MSKSFNISLYIICMSEGKKKIKKLSRDREGRVIGGQNWVDEKKKERKKKRKRQVGRQSLYDW